MKRTGLCWLTVAVAAFGWAGCSSSSGSASMDAGTDGGTDAQAGDASSFIDASSDAGLDAGADAGSVFCPGNLVSNGTFDTDITGWMPAFGVNTVSFDTVDADGSASSGSLHSVTTRQIDQRDPISQCMTVAANTLVTASAKAYITPTAEDGGTDTGDAQLTLIFYSQPNCGGVFDSTMSSPMQSNQGQWVDLSLSATSSLNAVSMRVSLDVYRRTGSQLVINWDDICAQQ